VVVSYAVEVQLRARLAGTRPIVAETLQALQLLVQGLPICLDTDVVDSLMTVMSVRLRLLSCSWSWPSP
jgi:hypothetical protein